MVKEIRDIKMDRVMGIDNPIDKKFQEIWNGLSILNCDVYNTDGREFIYYNKERQWVFYQDSMSEFFWCNYERYWSIFEPLILGESERYRDIQRLTKFLVEDKLKGLELVTIQPNETSMVSGQTCQDVGKVLTYKLDFKFDEVSDTSSVILNTKLGKELGKELGRVEYFFDSESMKIVNNIDSIDDNGVDYNRGWFIDIKKIKKIIKNDTSKGR